MLKGIYLVFQHGGIKPIAHSSEKCHGISHRTGLTRITTRSAVGLFRVVQSDTNRTQETGHNAEYLAISEPFQTEVIREGECERAGQVAA